MTTYQALRIHNDDQGYRAVLEELSLREPGPGEVLVRVSHSSINFKDALAGTGRGKILRTFPLVGGVDAAGRVERSSDDRYREGDAVIATGWGMSFDRDGGYAEYLCVPGDWLVPCPAGLDPRSAMILGTAGFTAALAVHRMQVNGQRPELGPVLVTGATGGVGSIAVDLLNRLGYAVAAVSGKSDLHDWLRSLGATRILGRDELPGGDRPLEQAVWGGAVDNVGGDMLARITRTVQPWGNIASIGLAGGHELRTTVMPFILRGVSLLGCNSVDVPLPLRRELWSRLADGWRPLHLDDIHTATETLETLPEAFERLLGGGSHGRVLVEIGPT
jgi:NADPH2:quinone reductase